MEVEVEVAVAVAGVAVAVIGIVAVLVLLPGRRKASKYLPNSRGLITESTFLVEPPVLMMDLGTR